MKEFMLLIMNEGDGKASLSPEQQQQFLKACEVYIDDLTKKGKLKSAQPLARQGVIIAGSVDSFRETSVDDSIQIQVGYYHIVAKDMDEAVAIAKRNPELTFVKNAKVHVRPIKTSEETTKYVYPTHK